MNGGAVDITILDGCAVITATPEGEESSQFQDALASALSEGFTQLDDEYYDQELDRYVYVFTPLEEH